MDCPTCRGKRHYCPDCLDPETGQPTGTIPFHRCPHTYYGERELEICRSVVLAENGILPVAGGFCDQAATWVDAFGVVAAERAHYLNEKD